MERILYATNSVNDSSPNRVTLSIFTTSKTNHFKKLAASSLMLLVFGSDFQLSAQDEFMLSG